MWPGPPTWPVDPEPIVSPQPATVADDGGIAPLAYILPAGAIALMAGATLAYVAGPRRARVKPERLGSGPRGVDRAARVERAGRRTESAPGQEATRPLLRRLCQE